MGHCVSTPKIAPESLDVQIRNLLDEYHKLVFVFLRNNSYILTMELCNRHKLIHMNFNKFMEQLTDLMAAKMYTMHFEILHNHFVDILINLYEKNELTIDEDLRKTEQIRKMFNL